jgi:hypothetical protein
MTTVAKTGNVVDEIAARRATDLAAAFGDGAYVTAEAIAKAPPTHRAGTPPDRGDQAVVAVGRRHRRRG